MKIEKTFFLTFFVVLLIKIFLLDPSLSFNAELWAETGTNFLFHAQQTEFWSSFRILDFGYFPLLQRIWGHVVYHLIPLNWIPQGFQFFSLIFISFCCASPALKVYQRFFSSPWQPFFLGFVLACNLEYENHSFVNFPYWAIIPAFFHFSLLSEETNPKSSWPLTIFLALSFLSKGTFFIVFPFLGLLATFHFLKNRQPIKNFLQIGILFLASFIQFIFVFSNRMDHSQFSESRNPVELVATFVLNILALPMQSFGQNLIPWPEGVFYFVSCLVCSVFFSLLFFTFYQKNQRRALAWVSLFIFIALPSALISILVYPKIFQSNVWEFKNDFSYFGNRTLLIPFTVFYLTFVMVFLDFIARKNWFGKIRQEGLRYFLVFFILFKINSVYHQFSFQKIEGQPLGNANWQRDKEQFLQKDYCIQLNPSHFKMGTLCPK